MKKNMTGNRKFNRRRFVAAAGAGLTAAAVLISAVLGRSIEAEAADTLIGIEKLRTRVKESGKEFVVLEIVPDKAAAEIGFLFKDLEPILSEWDKDAMEWNKWENILCSLPSYEERFQFVQGKKAELKEYYAQIGLKSAFPVTAEDGDYEESDGPASGFRKITSDSVKRSGWFEPGEGDYQVAFGYVGPYDEDGSFDKDVLYYTVSGEPVAVRSMSEEDLANISPDTFVYSKTTNNVDGDIYRFEGTWEEVQEQALMSIMSQPDDEEAQDDSEKSDDEDGVDKDDDSSEDGEDSEGAEDGDSEDGEDDGNGDDNDKDIDEGTGNIEGGDDGDVDDSTGDGNGESGSTDGSDGNGNGEDVGIDNGDGNNEGIGSGNADDNSGEGGGTSGTGGSEENGDEQGVNTTAKASMPLSININQGKWFLLAEGDPADGSDSQKTSGDTNSNDTGSGSTDSEGAESGNAGSGDTGSEGAEPGNTGSDGTDSEGTDSGDAGAGSEVNDSDNIGSDDSNSEEAGDDDGYADDMNSDDEDNEDNEDADSEDGEGEEDDETPARDVFANEETPKEYYFVQFERYNQVNGVNVYAVDQIVESKNGQYIFRECEAVEDQEGVTYQNYTFPGRTIYCKNTFKSNEWFRKYVINMEESDYEDFPVKVLTLTPQELNEMEQLPNFDFLYLNSGLRAWGTPGGNVADSGSSEEGSDNGGNELFRRSPVYDSVEDDIDGSSEDGSDEDSEDNGSEDSSGEGSEEAGPDEEGEDSGIGSDEDGTSGDSVEGSDEDGISDGFEADSEEESSSENSKESDSEGEGNGSATGSNDSNWIQYVSLNEDANPENAESGEGNGLGEETGEGEDSESEGDTDPDEEVTYATYVTEGNDLSSDVLKYFFEKAIAGAKPCLVDGSILYAADENSGGTVVNEELEKTNIFRLAAMLCQEGLSEWYEDHRNNYGSLTTKQLMDGIVEDADKNFVTEQVYCRFGDDSIINDLFFTATIYEEGGEMEPGFQPVLDEILLENLYREADTSGNYKPLSTDISQAKAVRHILNYSDRRKVETKKNIKVLEIQPALADESELTLEQLQAWAPGVETAEITVMTTSEFIGKIEKLNENYDLIYIGTSKDHLNMRYWVGDKNYTGKPDKDHIAAGTAFNDIDMDGLIYYNIGDLRVVSMPLAGQLDTEYWGGNRNDNVYYYNYVRYPGNDITEEKKEALLSFLDGSYPVVVADDFFESPVTVYATPGYKDGRVNLSEGEYTHDDLVALGIAGGDISSVKVKEGYKVTFYNGWYFEDDPAANRHSVSFTKDESDFNNVAYAGGGNWNNKPNSLKVERIGDGVPTREIDGDHIDNCTYLYEFVEQAMEDNYVNFYAWSDITDESELFKFYLNRPKVSLTDVTVNGNTKEGSGNDVRYIEAGINGRYNLQYSFTIRNEGAASYNTRYQCKLYIDINSDGKFSEQEEISDINLSQGGSYVSANELYADRTYLLTREVPSGYKGLLPWKVEITQVDNPNIYTSIQGYTKLEGMDPEQIKVIQIGRDRITDVGWEALGWDEDLFDLGAEIRGETNYKDWTNTENYFHTLVYGGWIGDTYYEGITDDFDIDVTFMTISEFETRYYGGQIGEEYYEANPDLLDDYNMLILGFSDMYGDFTGDAESGPMGAILDFVNSGKSVLFAHDTTSYFNYDKKDGNYLAFNGVGYPYNDNHNFTSNHEDYHNASTLNKYLRNLVGMDRYGVLASDILKKGQSLSQGDGSFEQITNSESWRYDVAYKPKSGKTQTVPQVHGYTYLTINAKDFSHRDDGNSDVTYGAEKTTFNSWNVDTSQTANGTFYHNYTNIRYDTVQYKNGQTDADLGRRNGEIAGNRNGEVDHVNVTQVNQGQITEYPYKLAEKFEVAETHGQYYQLDYTADDDNDGESDLVVWYCLSSRYEDGETIYTQSPNDVRNNYYIYNKGNITYTGMGHNVHKSGKYTLEEAKLFINTIIAAYQAGVKDPYISVLKTGLPESQELKTLYRYYDPTNDFSLNNLATTEDYEKIYFTVQDINFIKGSRSIATRVFYEAADGGEMITVSGKEISVNQLAVNFYNAADGSPVDANNLQSGGIYYILAPKSFLENCESGLNLYFEAQTTLTTSTTNENVYKTEKVYAKLQVLQAYLFNLE